MYLWSTISRNTYSRLIEPCLYNQMKKSNRNKRHWKLPPPFPRSCWKLCCWKSWKVQRIKQKRNRCLVDSIVEHRYLSDKDFTTCLQCVILMFLLLISPTTWLKISRQEPKSCSRKHYLLHDKHLKITKGNIDPFPQDESGWCGHQSILLIWIKCTSLAFLVTID